MARARTVVGVLVGGAVVAAAWFLFVRERSGSVSGPRARTEVEAPTPALLEGRAAGAGEGKTVSRGNANAKEIEAVAGAAEAGSIEGTVTGWDGKPAGGLTVDLVPPEPPLRPRSPWDRGPAPLAEAKTDEGGRYVLSGLPTAKSGVVVVRVSDTYEVRGPVLRWQPRRLRCDLDLPTPATLEVRLAARPGEQPRLRQLTLTNEFLEFALHREEEEELPWGMQMWEEGRMARVLAGPGPVRVKAWLDSAPPVEGATTLVSGATTELVLEVPADGVVRGRVVDPHGRPVARGSVSWTGDRNASGDLKEDGTFRLAGVGRGRGRLVANVALEGVIGQVEASADGIVPDGSDVQLVVRPPPRVTFRVEGLREGASFTVALVSRSRVSMATFPPKSPDTLSVHPFPGEPTLLWLMPFVAGLDAAESARRRGEFGAPVLVDLPRMAEGDERDVGVLRLRPGVEVRGRVTTVDGVGVPGLELKHLVDRMSLGETTTDAAGRFTLSGLPARPFLLRARGGDFPQHLVPIDPSSPAEVIVVVTRGGFADVRVVDGAGRAVPNAPVTVLPAGEFPYDSDFDETRFDTAVGPEGRARFRMCVGPRRLKAHGKDKATSETADVTIREGETTEVTLTLREKPAR